MIFDKFYGILDASPDSACMSEIRRGKTVVRTYAEFYRDVMRVAGGLPDMQGERALVFLRPGIDFFVALLACWVKGAAVLLPNDLQNVRGLAVGRVIADRLTYLPARALFKKAELSRIDALRARGKAENGARPRCADGDAALVTFTSGSGGKAKEIVRTFGELSVTTDFLTAKFGAVRPQDRLLITLPTYVLAVLSLGAESVLCFKKTAGNQKIFGRLLRERSVNGIIGSAAKLALADGPYLTVEKVFAGGSALKKRAAEICRADFPRAEFRLLYGTSECPVIATADLDEYRAELDNGRILLGRPVGGVSVTVAADGELVAASELTAGVARPTGDLGFMTDGRLFLLGKKNCSDAARGIYGLTLENEIEKRFPGIGPVAFLHHCGENYLFAAVGRARGAELARAYPFLRIVRRSAPADAKHGGKIDYRRAVAVIRRYEKTDRR